MPVPRVRFRRGLLTGEFVVTAPLKMTNNVVVLPGEDFDIKPFTTRYLRSLYRRKRIGIKGSEWANGMIARFRARRGHVEARPVVEEPAPPVDRYRYDSIRVTQKGSWFSVAHDGEEIARLHGQTALDEWKLDHLTWEDQQHE